MRKMLLTAAVALLGAASLSACSSMDSGGQSAAPTPSGVNVSATAPDSLSQSAPSPQDVPR